MVDTRTRRIARMSRGSVGGWVFTQLTGVSVTASKVVDYADEFTFQYKIASISTSVTVRFEGTLNGTDWANLDADGVDTTKDADGTYQARYRGHQKEVRFRFVSKDGGSPTIDVEMVYGNSSS